MLLLLLADREKEKRRVERRNEGRKGRSWSDNYIHSISIKIDLSRFLLIDGD